MIIISTSYVTVLDVKNARSSKFEDVPFVVRTTGGAATQSMGLLAAIYISQKIGRPFQIRHYPLSTGGFYPLGIGPLLRENELYRDGPAYSTQENFSGLTVGELLEPADTKKKHSWYDRIVVALARLGIDKYVNQLRMIWHIDGSFDRLNRTPYRVKVVSPNSKGYFPFSDKDVIDDLRLRFQEANLPSIFGDARRRDQEKDPDVVIHVRLGDKRRAHARPDLGGAVNGIVDPISYLDLLKREGFLSSEKIYVVSDDPVEAQRLLAEAGIKAKFNVIQGDLWEDLALMSRSKLVLCPWSTVPQLSAVCLSGTDTRFYYPATAGDGIPPGWKWRQSNVNFYDAIFLPEDHRLYVTPYKSIAASHKIYEEKKA